MRRRDLLLYPSAVAAMLAFALALALTPLGGHLGACPLRAMTGVPCPTCGGMRALRALAGGQVGPAFLENPAVAGSALLLAASAIASLALLPFASRFSAARRLPVRPFLLIGLVLLAANWIYLLLRS